MKLHFGFESVPYSSFQPSHPRKGRVRHGYGEGKTSLQVAQELEKKYHVLEAFFDMEQDFIIPLVENAMFEDIEAVMMMTKPSKRAVSEEITSKIESRFRRDIAHRKFDGVIAGVPTKASIQGVSHLRVHPYASRASRPSFRDTGNYVNSFRAWTED